MNEIFIPDFVAPYRAQKEALDAAHKKANRRIAIFFAAKAVVVVGTLIVIHKINQIED